MICWDDCGDNETDLTCFSGNLVLKRVGLKWLLCILPKVWKDEVRTHTAEEQSPPRVLAVPSGGFLFAWTGRTVILQEESLAGRTEVTDVPHVFWSVKISYRSSTTCPRGPVELFPMREELAGYGQNLSVFLIPTKQYLTSPHLRDVFCLPTTTAWAWFQ